MNPIIKIEHLAAGYEGKEVLHDVNLTIYQDDYLGIIGPNGCLLYTSPSPRD